ncbi:hydrophobin-B [Macrolepiota fuliginosa MF-IS2]|uniref:Hydrophobin n=1 Tax=Macrolepiota fuliginosa MF-IS2 TaxID=1400762 RepID=A0A9P5XGK7_9AGAR|nr:hydrophobin-B [Macrolepiota fuliginosa MF-IS2]
MAFKFSEIVTITLVALVAIAPGIEANPHCNTGPIQCCNQVFSSKDHQAQTLLAHNGIGLDALAGVTGMVGAQCTPLTAIGVGSGSHCSGQTVCCQKNNWNGVVAVGCNPINVGA